MFERIFNEIFGNWDDVANKLSDFDLTDEDKNCTYYHCIKDKYDNGERVSHMEKEIKDGKVIKDVNETLKIENKKEEKKDDVEKKSDNEDRLKTALDLLEQAQETIITQQKQIDEYERHCYQLENKLNKITNLLT